MKNVLEERWAEKILQDNETNSTRKKEVNRWKRRENMEEEWNETEVKDIKKRVQDNGLMKWQKGMETKATLKWDRKKEKPEVVS